MRFLKKRRRRLGAGGGLSSAGRWIVSDGPEGLIDHPPPLGGLGPAPARFFSEGGDWIEKQEFLPRLDARCGENTHARVPIVVVGGVDVAFSAPPGRVEDKGRRIEAGGRAANIALQLLSGPK